MTQRNFTVYDVLEIIKKGDYVISHYGFRRVLNRQIKLGRVKENPLEARMRGARRYVLTRAGRKHMTLLWNFAR